VGPREKSTARRCAPPRSATSDTYEGDTGTMMRGSSESDEDDRDAALMPSARAGGTGQA